MNTRLKITHMTMADVEAVAQLERECFADPWSYESFVSELNNIMAHYIVMYAGDELIAYGGMWVVFDEAHVTNVAVSPIMRRRGYGEVLMRALMRVAIRRNATRMTLEVRKSNEAARQMYKKLEFYPRGMRKAYYANNGEDAVIMWNDDITLTEARLRRDGAI